MEEKEKDGGDQTPHHVVSNAFHQFVMTIKCPNVNQSTMFNLYGQHQISSAKIQNGKTKIIECKIMF